MNKYKIIFYILLCVPIIMFILKYISNYKIEHQIMIHHNKLVYLHKEIEKLIPKLSEEQQEKLSKIKLQPSKKSYTIDKHHIHLCIIDRETNEYYEDNLLIYVLLHEIAHIFCDEEGHTEKYIKIFKNLINIATDVGIFDPTQKLPSTYCGVPV